MSLNQAAVCGCRTANGHLTMREVDVLVLGAAGIRSEQIARKLGISVRTVDQHFATMLRRAAADSRVS